MQYVPTAKMSSRTHVHVMLTRRIGQFLDELAREKSIMKTLNCVVKIASFLHSSHLPAELP